jgi:hypothetical protein
MGLVMRKVSMTTKHRLSRPHLVGLSGGRWGKVEMFPTPHLRPLLKREGRKWESGERGTGGEVGEWQGFSATIRGK